MTARGTRRPVPDHLFGGRLSSSFLLDLEVAAVRDDRPHVRTITFTSADLIGFAWQPGQDVMFEVPDGVGTTRRRYTIRRANPLVGTLDIEVVLHGVGPFGHWAAAAKVGDRISGIGPRGVVTINDRAEHHLFVADDSAIPFAFAMIEALSPGTTATAIVATDDLASMCSDPPSAAEVDVQWVSPDDLADCLQKVPLEANTAAYVNGERSLVRDATAVLTARGVDREIAAKVYWRRDQPNATHGEPAKEEGPQLS